MQGRTRPKVCQRERAWQLDQRFNRATVAGIVDWTGASTETVAGIVNWTRCFYTLRMSKYAQTPAFVITHRPSRCIVYPYSVLNLVSRILHI